MEISNLVVWLLTPRGWSHCDVYYLWRDLWSHASYSSAYSFITRIYRDTEARAEEWANMLPRVTNYR